MKFVLFTTILVTCAFARFIEKKRISELKCEEYSDIIPRNCSTKISSDPNGVAKLKDFPFVGAIGFDFKKDEETKWVCSGTLISERFVLTTARCAMYKSNKCIARYVRFGSTHISSPDPIAETYSVTDIIYHPVYKTPHLYNNIALLKLNRPVEFSEYIFPACLHFGEEKSVYEIAGFSYQNIDYTMRKGVLLHHRNKVAKKEVCKETFTFGRRLRKGVDFDTQFCMKEDNITCTINKGAPILVKDENLQCMQKVAGIVDIADGFCATKISLNIKVTSHIDWIESIVWP